jgi:ribosomal protein S18 acetylase RimI-like enzyme
MMASTAAGQITLRLATESDDNFLRELFETSKPHLQQLPLPEQQRCQLVDMQWRAQRSGYAAAYPGADDLIIEVGGRAVGRLICDRSGTTATVVDVAISPADRNHGIGTAVLADMINQADTTKLRVAADNPARRLYERLGFRVCGHAGIDLAMESSRPGAAPESR